MICLVISQQLVIIACIVVTAAIVTGDFPLTAMTVGAAIGVAVGTTISVTVGTTTITVAMTNMVMMSM
jgi:hypothetical protein